MRIAPVPRQFEDSVAIPRIGVVAGVHYAEGTGFRIYLNYEMPLL
jgi:hypothetical protein